MRATCSSKLGMSVSFRDAKKAAGDGMLIDLARDQKGLGHSKAATIVAYDARYCGRFGRARQNWGIQLSNECLLLICCRCSKGIAADHAKVAPARPVEGMAPRARAAMRARRAKAAIGPAGTRQTSARLGGIIESKNNTVSVTLSHPAIPAGPRTSQAAATAA